LFWRLAKSDFGAIDDKRTSHCQRCLEKFHDPRSLRLRRVGANRLEIFY
jgi:hypothetical protein